MPSDYPGMPTSGMGVNPMVTATSFRTWRLAGLVAVTLVGCANRGMQAPGDQPDSGLGTGGIDRNGGRGGSATGGTGAGGAAGSPAGSGGHGGAAGTPGTGGAGGAGGTHTTG